ncbi:flavocytochrome c [Mesoterricola silvestris]|uniref:Flavocytochrome c n=1 Tax=Mesoterricola silvestris TaxID=2927979 RepID=A0AA48KBN8_9BACT|nr:flavocytochrome c [Mesoterricola silvestris]BDU72698.1 flavocytochrome c [Mesoterricola silvestris]
MSNEPKEMSRRGFMSTGGAALLGGVVLGALPMGAKEPAAPSPLPRTWDASFDVVVVGTGFAGLTAAIEARLAGATVLVIDKMPLHGGNSIINGGDFAAAGNSFQKEAGVQDSPELMLKDMLRAGSYLNHPDLARMVAEHSNEALEWCRTFIGAKFNRLNFHGGHSVKRSVQTYNQSGSGLVNPLLAKAKALGVEVLLRTKMIRLITGGKGRIVGLEVRRNFKWPDDASGTPGFIKARRAVVLAAGGFSQDIALRQIHDPRLTPKFESTNHPGATGEAILAACSAGAMDVQMDWIQLGPWTSPDEPGFGHGPQVCERIVGYGLMVDPATGKRFFKETGNRKERADAIIAIGHPVIILGDSYAIGKQVVPKVLGKAMEVGVVKKFDTLEALAAAYGVPVQPFLDQVARWNGFVEKGKDEDFDCKLFPDSRTTAAAPFYAMRLWPRVHHTMGGLVVNVDTQVIGFDLKPIKGLYAAGEITGGVHGAVRLGSVAMADCVVNGRIAGRKASAEKPWS